jgi:hypothetical protein
MRIDLPRRPLFVIGTGRCGTTLLTDLIQGPRIRCLKERQVQSRFAQFGNHHIFYLRYRGDISEEVFLALFRTARTGHLRALPAGHVYCEKIPHGQWAIEEIRRVFPGAKFLEIHREGKDTVQSMIHAGWYAPEDTRPRWAPRGPLDAWHAMPQFEKCCTRYAHTIAHTLFNRMTMPSHDYMAISYEDLMDDPGRVLQAIESFAAEELFRGRVELKPSRENWRTWTAEQLDTYHAILGEAGMRAQAFLGYEACSTSVSS